MIAASLDIGSWPVIDSVTAPWTISLRSRTRALAAARVEAGQRGREIVELSTDPAGDECRAPPTQMPIPD